MWVLGALSGYGVMAALGAGSALAAWATGEEPPPWALAFAPGRFLDPSYRLKGEAARFQL